MLNYQRCNNAFDFKKAKRTGNRLRPIQVTWMKREQMFWVSYPHPEFADSWAVFVARGAHNRDEALEMYNNWCHTR